MKPAITRKIEWSAQKSVQAALVFAVFSMIGCFEGGGSLTNFPDTELSQVNLRVYLGTLQSESNTNPDVVLNKAAASRIEMRDMIVSFTSNLRDTVWDTLAMGSLDGNEMLNDTPDGGAIPPGFPDGPGGGFSVWASVNLAPLRWWMVEVRTYDMNDSLIHHNSAGPFASRGGGESVNVSIPVINPRFSLYEARYRFPEEIFASNVGEEERISQKIFFSRLVMRIDGDIIRDSTSFHPSVVAPGTRFIEADSSRLRGEVAGSYFFRPSVGADTITHTQSYTYVKAGAHEFDIRAYGYLEGDSVGAPERLLFRGRRTLEVDTGTNSPQESIPMVFHGKVREDESDTSTVVEPEDPDWSGVALEVTLGGTSTVVQPINLPDSLPF